MPRSGHTISRENGGHIIVRVAGAADGQTLARLAALDSAPELVGPTLVAEIDGEAAAALPIAGGSAVADPFRHTSAAVELLELRAAQIRGQARRAAPPASYRERLRAFIRVPRTVSPR